ncbi:MAG TPA: hypothetical protein VN841_00490 [Bryobacteraceae bacterium]|nr:hypothetical protein [Bryobacteraceae bacterium]
MTRAFVIEYRQRICVPARRRGVEELQTAKSHAGVVIWLDDQVRTPSIHGATSQLSVP